MTIILYHCKHTLVIGNGFILTRQEKEKNIKKHKEIKNKMEIMCGMYNCSNLNEEDQNYVIKQFDKMMYTLSKRSRKKN